MAVAHGAPVDARSARFVDHSGTTGATCSMRVLDELAVVAADPPAPSVLDSRQGLAADALADTLSGDAGHASGLGRS